MSYNIIARDDENTVVTEYTPSSKRSSAYQSETALENELIRLLTEQGYEHLKIHNESAFISNLRRQLETLNSYPFSDDEWRRFFSECIANNNEGIVEKTRKIQADHVQILRRDDGSTKNIYLFDKNHIHNNRLQVINQYEETEGDNKARYDVTILVNGLPLVHVELKRRGVDIREAFNQIKRYQQENFWAASGLYEYVQIFVISNGTFTKYYSNTTRDSHIKEGNDVGRKHSRKTSNSFEFTSFWADANNHNIPDLVDFAKTFLARHTILNILSRYCVFTAQNMLLVMRPYQIVATERIINRIEIANNYKTFGSIEGGGYIWHTTGSGKTLTSFKTAQLATKLGYIDKVLFVVDRKDLDYQTMKEYDRFEKGAANGNASTAMLKRQLENNDAKIIITTIQKLAIFIKNNAGHSVFNKRVVIIFDECHRSQFGAMHESIVNKSFKNYHLFGFTGTPIVIVKDNRTLKTTKQVFGERLHTYTIVDAIRDGNVLPFLIDHTKTVKQKEGRADKRVAAIDTERALSSPERVRKIVSYILEHFDQKTKRNNCYTLEGQRVSGFNSIFAVASIPMAMKYYTEFKKQLAEIDRKMVVATIFSYCENESDPDDILPDEDFDTDSLDKPARDFLKDAIADYNSYFNTAFDISADKFQNYYKDLSQRVKNREIDLLIVVNMFLTGFDATTLNTLWVDKNLRMHGLIQAFSRTNRILNSVKTYGNIVCFRDLQKEINAALSLFSDEKAQSIILLKSYDAYYNGYNEDGKHYPGYAELIDQLTLRFPLGKEIIGDKNKKDFISLFGTILRLKNILTAFDTFAGNEILSERDMQDYQSIYIDLWHERTLKKPEKENINDDIVFEIELIQQVEINIDYILMLVAKYHASNCEDKEILVTIDKAINSTTQLRSKKELIQKFICTINASSEINTDWRKFSLQQKETDLSAIIAEECLNPDETRKFIDNSFRVGVLKTTGTDIDKIMPPVSRFGGGRADKKQIVIEKLTNFFNKYSGLV